jgi:N-acetylglucosaminyl-diphospho-decaprenol L-rhamnosyltransferase
MVDANTLTTNERREARPALHGMAPAPLDLSIAIVTWNSERWIERCLASIEEACEGVAHEIIVYDNASTDGTLHLVGDGPRIVRGDANAGFAAGINRAAADARGRYVFLLNPDCELAPGALALLVRYLDAHPEAAAAAPLLSDNDGSSQREFQLRRLPTVGMLLAEVFGLSTVWPSNPITRRYRYRDLDVSVPRMVEQPAAAALLLRRDVLADIGPFDERFAPAWFEDVDYCRRLAIAGKRIVVVPDARARHFGGASLEHVSFGEFTELWYRNMWLYARKWFGAPQAEALRYAVIAGMLLRVPAALLGMAHREAGRWNAARAYARVAAKAFHRWSKR